MTSGPRPARPHLGSVVGITCLSLFVLVVVLLVGLAYDLVRLRGQVAHIRTDSSSAEQALMAVPVDRARLEQQVRRLQDDTAALRARTHSPAWRMGSAVPVLGGSLRAGTSVALVADDVSRRALPLLADLVVDLRTFTRTGPLDVSPVSRRRAELEDVDARLMVDEQTLGRQDLSDPSVRKAFVLVKDRLHQLQGALSALTTVARVGPAMTGELGDRRYLVVLQTPGESRATGGLVGGYLELRVRRGAVTILRSGTNHDLRAGRQRVPVDAGFAQLWGRVGAQQQCFASNLSVDFPSVARVWTGLYEQQFGVHLDGALAITPESVGRLLRVTGPLRLPGGDELSSDNIAGALEVSLYKRFPKEADETARNAYQLAVLHELSTAVLRPLPGDRTYADALRGGGAGTLLLASTHRDEQAQLRRAPIAHALPTDGHPFVAWSTQNAAGTKLDVYVHRELSYQVKTWGDRQLVRAGVTLRNDAPATGLPSYVTTRFDLPVGPRRASARAGTDKLAVATYLSQGARIISVTLDGTSVAFGQGVERGHPVVTLPVLLQPAGGTATVVVTAEQPRLTGPLETLDQPVPNPDVRDGALVDLSS